MSSLLTNTTAMTALQTLRSVSTNLATTQNRISTGLRGVDGLGQRGLLVDRHHDAFGQHGAERCAGRSRPRRRDHRHDVHGPERHRHVVSQIKAKLVAARTPGVDRGKIQSEITELQKQLKNTADSAVFNGENWISVDSASAELQRLEDGRFVLLPRRRRGQASPLAVTSDSIKLYDKKSDMPMTPGLRRGDMAASTATAAAAGNITVQVGGGARRMSPPRRKRRSRGHRQDINKLGIDGLTVGGGQGRAIVLRQP